MPAHDQKSDGSPRGRPKLTSWLSRSISGKLTLSLVASLLVCFGLLGYLNVRLHRKHLEQSILTSAERISDVIKRSTSYSMLRNDREGLYHIIATTAAQPGLVRIRIFNKEGRISFSTASAEVGTFVDKKAEACFACHSQSQPIEHLDRPDRFRIFHDPGTGRVLGIINPIENQPSCSNAACHAHPPDQKILGVLDTTLSLAVADADVADSSRQMVVYTIAAILLIGVFSAVFIRQVVYAPLRRLQVGTEQLAAGALGFQIGVDSRDEVGELADSFNAMSRQLREAREEITAWAATLEKRVEQKTRELQRAQEEVLQAEKLASIGKLAAVVAHEINNPLAGILTYTKLLKKWLASAAWDEQRRAEVRSSLDLIESESRRCGEIVRNLLMFSRSAPMNIEPVNLNAVVERSLFLVKHQLELGGIELRRELAAGLPSVPADAAQLEQVFVALIINAVDAMPHGGTLTLRSEVRDAEAIIEVEDDGVGVPADLLPHLFEPFFTTKERGHGVGLGLAVSRGIVERHGGRIEVQSTPGRGTKFTIRLPLAPSSDAKTIESVQQAR
jgi:two-component system NtrC family sensor kinase